MTEKILFILSMLLVSINSQVYANETHDERFMRKFEASLDYKKGTVPISENRVTLKLMEGFRFLDERDSKKVISGLWGQDIPENSDGAILPPGIGPFSDHNWAYVISFDPIGHICDTIDVTIDSEKLMSKLKQNLVNENLKRQNENRQTMQIVDWEIKPVYDKTIRCLYWAIKYSFSNEIQNEIIYNIKILGRNGVLSIYTQVNEKLGDLPRNNIKDIIRSAKFNPGQEYEAFSENTGSFSKSNLSELITGTGIKEETIKEIIIDIIGSYRRFMILLFFASVYLITKHFIKNRKA